MPRLRLYHTRQEKRQANARKALKYYHKNREKINENRRKTNVSQATSNTSGSTDSGRLENGTGNVRSKSKVQKPSTSTSRSDPREAGTCSSEAMQDKTSEQYWSRRLRKIVQKYERLGPSGQKPDREYCDDLYNKVLAAQDDTQLAQALEKLYDDFIHLKGYIETCEGQILQYLDNGDMLGQFQAFKQRLAERTYLVWDMAYQAMGEGKDGLIKLYNRQRLKFQK
ncbi:hypothetical protein VNI00_007578 [Paramarasmius palmivorus]|uniref:Uncharacterized protein n=1 Tax=Paramarasmius palmivorus TaxID=297713 RepID=A0AAW0D205_9AGAR